MSRGVKAWDNIAMLYRYDTSYISRDRTITEQEERTKLVIELKEGGVQLHFCTWPPDFCQMYMYKNVQKCTKYVFSCLEVP